MRSEVVGLKRFVILAENFMEYFESLVKMLLGG